jgi:molybdopterin-guanine dinucleotide biosynthesis protein A
VVPRLRGLPEPLLAVYAARLAPVVARRLAAGRRKVAALLDEEPLRVGWLDEPELRRLDPALRSFDDVDTPEDLARWQAAPPAG